MPLAITTFFPENHTPLHLCKFNTIVFSTTPKRNMVHASPEKLVDSPLLALAIPPSIQITMMVRFVPNRSPIMRPKGLITMLANPPIPQANPIWTRLNHNSPDISLNNTGIHMTGIPTATMLVNPPSDIMNQPYRVPVFSSIKLSRFDVVFALNGIMFKRRSTTGVRGSVSMKTLEGISKMPNSPISTFGLNRNPRNINIYSSGYDSTPSSTSNYFSILEMPSIRPIKPPQIIRLTIAAISPSDGFRGLNCLWTLFMVPSTMVSICSSW